MKNSSLRKKSPVFRQGYRTGRDVAAAFDVMCEQTVEDRMTVREKEIAEVNFTGGRRLGYREGAEDASRGAIRESGVSGIVVGVVVGMAAVGGFFIGVAL
ncbi:MAG: hypothetical protein IIA11_02690 [Proteobacteria bacterium]|nr:hypothetical protein [Pseudomonadota bacterium]